MLIMIMVITTTIPIIIAIPRETNSNDNYKNTTTTTTTNSSSPFYLQKPDLRLVGIILFRVCRTNSFIETHVLWGRTLPSCFLYLLDIEQRVGTPLSAILRVGKSL